MRSFTLTLFDKARNPILTQELYEDQLLSGTDGFYFLIPNVADVTRIITDNLLPAFFTLDNFTTHVQRNTVKNSLQLLTFRDHEGNLTIIGHFKNVTISLRHDFDASQVKTLMKGMLVKDFKMVSVLRQIGIVKLRIN